MSVPENSGLSIGQLAASAGVNVESIRFYQRKGLMPTPRRPVGGMRRYGEEDARRLGFIKAAQRLGFSLTEVAELLTLDDGTQCRDARQLAELKLRDIRQRREDLQRIEQALGRHIEHCRSATEPVPCPLIEALFQE